MLFQSTTTWSRFDSGLVWLITETEAPVSTSIDSSIPFIFSVSLIGSARGSLRNLNKWTSQNSYYPFYCILEQCLAMKNPLQGSVYKMRYICGQAVSLNKNCIICRSVVLCGSTVIVCYFVYFYSGCVFPLCWWALPRLVSPTQHSISTALVTPRGSGPGRKTPFWWRVTPFYSW